MGPLTEAMAVAGPNEKRAEPSTPESASKEMWMGSDMIEFGPKRKPVRA